MSRGVARTTALNPSRRAFKGWLQEQEEQAGANLEQDTADSNWMSLMHL